MGDNSLAVFSEIIHAARGLACVSKYNRTEIFTLVASTILYNRRNESACCQSLCGFSHCRSSAIAPIIHCPLHIKSYSSISAIVSVLSTQYSVVPHFPFWAKFQYSNGECICAKQGIAASKVATKIASVNHLLHKLFLTPPPPSSPHHYSSHSPTNSTYSSAPPLLESSFYPIAARHNPCGFFRILLLCRW